MPNFPCQRCGAPLVETLLFCPRCGTGIEHDGVTPKPRAPAGPSRRVGPNALQCGACGTQSVAGVTFCFACGAPVQAPVPVPAAVRVPRPASPGTRRPIPGSVSVGLVLLAAFVLVFAVAFVKVYREQLERTARPPVAAWVASVAQAVSSNTLPVPTAPEPGAAWPFDGPSYQVASSPRFSILRDEDRPERWRLAFRGGVTLADFGINVHSRGELAGPIPPFSDSEAWLAPKDSPFAGDVIARVKADDQSQPIFVYSGDRVISSDRPLFMGKALCEARFPKDNFLWTFHRKCEDAVRETLRAPSKAVFPGIFETQGDPEFRDRSSDGCVMKWASWVDAQNGFGATVRRHFVCQIQPGQRTATFLWLDGE